MELKSRNLVGTLDWPEWLSWWHLDDCSWSMGTVISLWYSVFLLSILKSQILLHFKWSCGPLFPKCNTVLLTFHLGVGGWSVDHNLKMLTMLENSHILGCWDPGPSYPGIKPTSRVSCTGRRVLYHQRHLLLRCLLETLLEIPGIHFQRKPTEPSTPC